MSGVWVFENGVPRRLESEGSERKRKVVLVCTQSQRVINSYSELEEEMVGLGWKRCYDEPDLLQFRKESQVLPISLPKDFTEFQPVHMHDIVLKTHNSFQAKEV